MKTQRLEEEMKAKEMQEVTFTPKLQHYVKPNFAMLSPQGNTK